MPRFLLSKSNYIKGCQCEKLLWLSKYNPETIQQSDDLQSFTFRNGVLVGDYAQQLFPDGTLIDYQLEFPKKLYETKSLIAQKKTIFEASFLFKNSFCMVDILFYSNNGWHLIEVKSSTGQYSSHLRDITFQYDVLLNNGVSVDSCWIYHINTSYNRSNDLDLNQLFTKVNVTDLVVIEHPKLKHKLHSIKHTLDSTTEPNIPIGPHCNSPYSCNAISYCWKNVPDYSVFNITGFSAKKKFNAYFQNKIFLDDISINDLSSFSQKLQLTCFKEDLDYINHQKLVGFLQAINYSQISFLDFEAFQTPIPPFPKSNPYQQIPFLYSLHVQSDSGLKHYDFIGDGINDPRLDLIESLIKNIPPMGSIIVYNIQYESMILSQLQVLFPQYHTQIQSIIDRMIDLMTPFKEKFIYLREMKGSASIKDVLPALIPSLSYSNLLIQHGASASIHYQTANCADKKNIIFNDLKDYCEMDTLAMVKILEILIELTNFKQ